MLFCGIDIGTTNSKAIILDEEMRLLDRITIPCRFSGAPCRPPAKIWHEHFCKIFEYFASKGLLSRDKVICSITAQGGSFALLDKSFRPICPAFSWTGVSSNEAEIKLKKTFDKQMFYHTTGWLPAGWLVAGKLFDCFEYPVDIRKNFRYLACVPEFITAQLGGTFITDITNAQITGLCDFEKKEWSGKILEALNLSPSFLPELYKTPKIVCSDAVVAGTKIILATSSHDQYAAMKAAHLEKDGDIMLGTGTAWVINGKTNTPLFDDDNFLFHPGQDLNRDKFGFIVGFGPIGSAFEKLLNKLQVNIKDLPKIESEMNKLSFPEKPIKGDLREGIIDEDSSQAVAIRRFMEAVAAKVAFMLEKVKKTSKIKKLVMTGGATASSFWPAAIANICGIEVEAVDFPEFTAYGAALFAKEAVQPEKQGDKIKWPENIYSKSYAPEFFNSYQNWYLNQQKSLLKKEFDALKKS